MASRTGQDPLGVLDDIVVVDLAPMMPGQFATMLLGDLGARVIKVERPGRGDFARTGYPGSHESVNRNKESITLDLKQPVAQEVLHRLVRHADVVLESFRPGVANRLGADYETVRALKPDLVYCSLSGFGQTGPYRDRTGHDTTYLGVAGVLSLAGDPLGPPEGNLGASVADLAGAWFAAMSIIAALRARDRHGIGQYIDVSITDGAYALMMSRLTEYFANGEPDKATLMARPGMDVFVCSDGRHLSVAAIEDHFWRSLCRVLDLPQLLADERLSTYAERRSYAQEIRKRLADRFSTRTCDEWLAILQAADIPCAPVNDLRQAADDDYARDRGLIHWLEHPILGRTAHIGFPARFSATPATIRRRPPLLGEHTDAILGELGYDAASVAAMRKQGAV